MPNVQIPDVLKWFAKSWLILRVFHSLWCVAQWRARHKSTGHVCPNIDHVSSLTDNDYALAARMPDSSSFRASVSLEAHVILLDVLCNIYGWIRIAGQAMPHYHIGTPETLSWLCIFLWLIDSVDPCRDENHIVTRSQGLWNRIVLRYRLKDFLPH